MRDEKAVPWFSISSWFQPPPIPNRKRPPDTWSIEATCLPRCGERRGGMPSSVGTWKMVGATARDRDGKPLPEPYGGKGMGRVAFTAEGRMMAVTCDARPELPPGAARAYSSYCGNYTFD